MQHNTFSALTNFDVLAPNLLRANSEEDFKTWFNKLTLINRAALNLYLRKHKNEINPQYLKVVGAGV